MHMRGPPPNGMYAPCPLVTFDMPSENLSGLNSCTSSPHISLSWCKINEFSWTKVPAGKVKLPSLVSSCISRLSCTIGEYSLRTSLKIMFICKMRLIN
ncbi:hypothetical protein HanIR_Chr12g0578961 [Helianthus annuus]|nr:hypothetical protein HanIR_Chr12g0578961 [Helianthus annuus]